MKKKRNTHMYPYMSVVVIYKPSGGLYKRNAAGYIRRLFNHEIYAIFDFAYWPIPTRFP